MGTIYFGNEHGDPQFLFQKQLVIYSWVEYYEIGIIVAVLQSAELEKQSRI